MAVDAPALPGLDPQPRTARPTTAGQAWLWSSVVLTLAAFAVSIAAAPDAHTSPAKGLAWLLFVGSSVHVASTGWLFSFREVRAHAGRHRLRYIVVPGVLVAAAGTTAALLSQQRIAVALLGYFGWQFFHYQKQNLGLVALAATSQHVPAPTRLERRSIMATGWTGIAALMIHPGTLQLSLHPQLGWYPAVPFAVTCGGFAVCSAVGLMALSARSAVDRPIGYCATYLVGLCFPLPIFVFSSPYAAVGGTTIAHGLQYLVLVGMVTAGPSGNRAPLVRLVVLAGAALAVGTGMSLASHLHTGGDLARIGYGAYLGVVMAHFVVDAGLWRLRDAFPRRFLSSRLPSLLRPPASSVTDASLY